MVKVTDDDDDDDATVSTEDGVYTWEDSHFHH
jgi:hypothetical protein